MIKLKEECFMLPAMIFLVFNGIIPFIAFKYLGPAGCLTALLIGIPVSFGIVQFISNSSMNYLICKKCLLSFHAPHTRGMESAETFESKKQEIINEYKNRYIKINFFYVFLCFMACTIFAFTIYDGSLTLSEFTKACVIPFAIFDGIHFILELIHSKNFFDAILGVFIIGCVAMSLGGGVLLFMAVVYVIVQISVAFVGILLIIFVYLLYKLFG